MQKPAVERFEGRLHPKMSPRLRHLAVQGALTRIVQACAGRRGIAGPELHVYPTDPDSGEAIFVPDVAFISRERLASVPQGEARQKPAFSPDIAIEVRSPSDDVTYLQRKLRAYLATGSVLALDVDPATRTICAYAHGGVTEYNTGMRFEHPALPWLAFDVNDVFADLDEFGL